MNIFEDLTPRKAAVDLVGRNLPTNSIIVEIGSAREFTSRAYQMDGMMTLHLEKLAEDTNSMLYTVDVDPYTVYALQRMGIQATCQCGIEYLKNFEMKIDLLVLDANDVWTPTYKEAHLDMYMAARDKLNDSSFLILDDVWCIDNLGKAELVLPEAIKDGFHYLQKGYTVVMGR